MTGGFHVNKLIGRAFFERGSAFLSAVSVRLGVMSGPTAWRTGSQKRRENWDVLGDIRHAIAAVFVVC